jgi:hypothetical protein
MSNSATATDPACLDGIAEDRKLHHFRMWMKDFTKPASTKDEVIRRFRDWLDHLSDGEIANSHQRHYNPTYLNLLSVFGGELPAGEIHSLAVRCVKSKVWSESEYHYHLSKLLEAVRAGRTGAGPAHATAEIRLKGWDVDLLRSLLGRGRGLVICTFRFGLVRFIPVEIALLGFRAWEAVNHHTFEIMQSAFDSLGPARSSDEAPGPVGEAAAAQNIGLLKTVNAEEKTCTVQLVDALKRGEIVGLCIEGNTGSDGPWGETSKSVVSFFNHSLSAKNGAARLAAALGSPILPVAALRDGDGFGRLVFSEPIIPARGLRQAEAEKFVNDSMQSLYSLLESYARRHPEQWEGWSALHRWRLCDRDESPAPRPLTCGDTAEVAELLRGGGRLRINERRVAPLNTRAGLTWVDLKTLKGYQNPKWAGVENILQALSQPGGLGLPWLDGRGDDPAWRERVFELLAYLGKSGLVVTCRNSAEAAGDRRIHQEPSYRARNVAAGSDTGGYPSCTGVTRGTGQM